MFGAASGARNVGVLGEPATCCKFAAEISVAVNVGKPALLGRHHDDMVALARLRNEATVEMAQTCYPLNARGCAACLASLASFLRSSTPDLMCCCQITQAYVSCQAKKPQERALRRGGWVVD